MHFAFPLLFVCVGCDDGPAEAGRAKVVRVFGSAGGGPGEFLYPRPVAAAADGSLWVIDKAARVQHLSLDGRPLGEFPMPDSRVGKPVGVSVGPDGLLYVADTHYHRVIVFRPDGTEVRRFGQFGQADGEFIYPTDVAFGPAGQLLVSEYGGNDRVSVFDAGGTFLYSFGAPGEGAGQFSRPSALAADLATGRLYVADACNHRIAVYELPAPPGRARLIGSFGSAGREAGQLRYPYGLALMGRPGEPARALAVCEFGNNRVQIFSLTEGSYRSLATWGSAGREPGQLAFPWGVAWAGGLLAVVDAGNNRLQVWDPGGVGE